MIRRFVLAACLVGCSQPQPETPSTGTTTAGSPTSPGTTTTSGTTSTTTTTTTTTTTGSTPAPPVADLAGCTAESTRTDITNNAQYVDSRSRTWNPDGRLIATAVDHDRDGVREHRTDLAYDIDGNLVLERHDLDGDGVVDRSTRSTWDPSGLLVEEAEDLDEDGVPDVVHTYTYDLLGTLVRRETDRDGDGVADGWRDYEKPGRYGGDRGYVEDDDGDGVADTLVDESFDADGRPTWLRVDEGIDGIADEESTWSWWSTGALHHRFSVFYDPALVILPFGLNGYFDDRVWVTYDALGRAVLEHEEMYPQGTGPGGTFSSVLEETTTWTCPP